MRKGVWGDCVANIVQWMPGSKVIGSDGVGFGVSVVRMRKSVASSLGFGVWGFSWVISKVLSGL